MTQVRQIDPSMTQWEDYLNIYKEYLLSSWPDTLSDHDSLDIKLRQRLMEGDRGFFLFEADGNFLGLANVYISGLGSERTLNIAEFYIREQYRRKGYGVSFYEAMLRWGRRNGAKKIRLETDPDKEANSFWQALGLTLFKESRNVYAGELKSH